MDTNSRAARPRTTGTASAAVTGARHTRSGRNGQDAAATWLGDDAGAIVVCDGCSAGAASEVGARLASQLVIGALARQLAAGMRVGDAAGWDTVRAELVRELGRIVEVM